MSLDKGILSVILFFALFFGFSSCSPKVLHGLEKQSLKQSVVLAPMVDYGVNGQVNYRCEIHAFSNPIKGLMIFKQMENEERVVIITDFGLKVIDISYKNDGTYVLNYIMEHMDTDYIKGYFVYNIAMLIRKQISLSAKIFKNSEYVVYSDDSYLYFQKNNKTEKVERYRGSKLIATAEKKANMNIYVEQKRMGIFMKLTLVN
jgi:hypothetical protein